MNSIVGVFIRKYLKSPKKEWLRFDSIFMVIGIILSVAVLTIAISLFDGYEKALKETILGANSHIYVFKPGENNLDYNDIDKLHDFLNNQDEVVSNSAIIMTQAMMVKGTRIKGCLIRGIDWKQKNLPTQYKKFIFTGDHELIGDHDIVLGYRLAELFQLNVGDTVKIINSLNSNMTPLGLKATEESFIVKGLYKSGMYEYDTKFVFMNLHAAELFSGLANERTMLEIEVKPDNIDQSDYLAYLWESELNIDDYNYQISSWIDFNGNLFSLLELQKWVIFFILSFLIVVASFNVVSAVSTAIMEKKKDLGILRAYGATNRQLSSIFIGKSVVLGLLATVIGLILGMALSLLLASQSMLLLKADVYFLDRIQVEFRPVTLILIFSVAVLIILAASYLPLRRIRKMQVTDVLRNE